MMGSVIINWTYGFVQESVGGVDALHPEVNAVAYRVRQVHGDVGFEFEHVRLDRCFCFPVVVNNCPILVS